MRFLLPLLLLAIALPVAAGIQVDNPLGNVSVYDVLGNIIKSILGISGAAALLALLWGGFLWLTSGGNSGRVDQGKKVLTWAAIGLVVMVTSYTLLSYVIGALTGTI